MKVMNEPKFNDNLHEPNNVPSCFYISDIYMKLCYVCRFSYSLEQLNFTYKIQMMNEKKKNKQTIKQQQNNEIILLLLIQTKLAISQW